MESEQRRTAEGSVEALEEVRGTNGGHKVVRREREAV